MRPTTEDTVVVNGITLTRAQIEQALKDLNAPKLMPGDRVRALSCGIPYGDYSVVGGSLGEILAKEYGACLPNKTRLTDGITSYCVDTSTIKKIA